jgi:hypothetical protein
MRVIRIVMLMILLMSMSISAIEKSEAKKVIGNIELVRSAIIRNWPEHMEYKKVFPGGTKVKLEVICIRGGKDPFVMLIVPEDYKIEHKKSHVNVHDLVGAHLAEHGSHMAENMKKGKKYSIEGIIVKNGMACYAAYFIYVDSFKPLSE